jgi:hypothetical protein
LLNRKPSQAHEDLRGFCFWRGSLLLHHSRVLAPYPPLCGGGALGEAGIQ